MLCQDKFLEIYKKLPEHLAFCPYRICPLGAHSDHNLGKITGFAIDKGIHIAYRPKQNGIVELCSLQFDKRAQWHIHEVPRTKEGDWADYLRGATLKLTEKYRISKGISGVIEGSLPIGGLSSSAAVVLVFLKALCDVNEISPTPTELIMMSVKAENEYVGVSSGKLDQSCEMYARKDHMLYLDTKDDTYELIPANPSMKPYKIAIFSAVWSELWQAASSTCEWMNYAVPPMPLLPMQAWSTESSKKQTCVTFLARYTISIRTAFLTIGANVLSIGSVNSIACIKELKHGDVVTLRNTAD